MPEPSAELERSLARIEGLVAALDQGADPAMRAAARELVTSLMELHGTGLERMLAVLQEDAGGRSAIERLADDDLVGSLLLLYGLHPLPLEARVRRALERSRPYLQSHKGDVELIGVEADGTVRLRLRGTCDGCPSSAVTLKLAIEEGIRAAAPDAGPIVVENPKAPVPMAEPLVCLPVLEPAGAAG